MFAQSLSFRHLLFGMINEPKLGLGVSSRQMFAVLVCAVINRKDKYQLNTEALVIALILLSKKC